MSNLWVNWRFWIYHLQIGRDFPYITIQKNYYHYKNPQSPLFERY